MHYHTHICTFLLAKIWLFSAELAGKNVSLFFSWKWKEQHQSPESASKIQGQGNLVSFPNYSAPSNTTSQVRLICLQHPSAPDTFTPSCSAQTANPACTIGSTQHLTAKKGLGAIQGRTSPALFQYFLRTAASDGGSTCMSPAKIFSYIQKARLKWQRSSTPITKKSMSLTNFLVKSLPES